MWGTAISYRLWCFIKSCCIQEEDTRGGVQGTAGAGDVDGSTKVTRLTPTRQLQPFQRQRPTRLDIKVPPIPARLGRNRRQRCVPRDAQVPGQRHPHARHRAVLRQIEVSGSLRAGTRAVPVVCRRKIRVSAKNTQKQEARRKADMPLGVRTTCHAFFTLTRKCPKRLEGKQCNSIAMSVLDQPLRCWFRRNLDQREAGCKTLSFPDVEREAKGTRQ